MFALLCCSLFFPKFTLLLKGFSGQSALAAASKQVVPGEWFHFIAAENGSWNHGKLLELPPDSMADNATTWSTKGLWNPGTGEFYFVGGGHCGGNCPQSTEVLRYDEAANFWTAEANNTTGHAYEGSALSTAGAHNNVYFRPYTSNIVQVYSVASHAWTGTLNPIPGPHPDCCLALEYFPDRDSLITIDNDWGIYEYSFTSNQWSRCLIGTTQAGCGSTHAMCGASSTSAPWARYDQTRHQILFGGCTNVYSLSRTLQVVQLAPAPFSVSSGISGSPITIDPQTGTLLSWDAAGNTFASDGSGWQRLGPSPFHDPIHGGLVCAPVATYHLNLCFYAGASGRPVKNGAVWLYRLGHNATSATVSSPASTSTSTSAAPILSASPTPARTAVAIAPPPNPASTPASITPASTTPASATPASTQSLPAGSANTWTNRTAGVNVPGGAASILGFQSFDTFPKNSRQQYFRLYYPSSITTDCSIAADGCSLKFSILPGYRQGEPGWFDWNFSPDLSKTFGEGQEFYVQYRERLDPAMLSGDNLPNGEGFKHDIITEGDTPSKTAGDCSNSPGELVLVQNGHGGAYPVLYHNCGFGGGAYGFIRSGYQAIQLGGVANSNFLDQDAAGCPHYDGRGIPDSDPTCFNYAPSEWFTVQIHVKVGIFGQPTSVLDVWLAHQGRTAQLAINAADAALVNDGSGGASGKYGKIQLSAYNTNMSGSRVSTAVWFDDLIASTRRIPDPGVATPNAPDSLSLTNIQPNSVTVNWRVNSQNSSPQNSSPQDDAGFLVERCRGNGITCLPNPQSGFKEIGKTAPGANLYVDKTVTRHATYTYRVRAINQFGPSAYTLAQCFNREGSCGGTAVIP